MKSTGNLFATFAKTEKKVDAKIADRGDTGKRKLDDYDHKRNHSFKRVGRQGGI
ncbi:MAG: hypothetical protein PHG29_00145 [Prolixibacteraceae bacterium]|jgi:hypothetical protein|nr:hypothetical protein [Prolixibacteraceae bacterium]